MQAKNERNLKNFLSAVSAPGAYFTEYVLSCSDLFRASIVIGANGDYGGFSGQARE
jgi:hypothetical protein